MSALRELIEKKVFLWPEGFDMLCVSKRSEWMLRVKQGVPPEERSGSEKFFDCLGPCSSLYKHQSYSKTEFDKLQLRRAQPESHVFYGMDGNHP